MRGFIEYATKHEFVNLPISTVSPSHTIAYLNSLTLRGLSGYTYNSHLALLRRMAGRMQERRIIKKNFTEGISKREVEESYNIPFTPDQKMKLEIGMQENRPELFLITRLIYFAFLRPSEITRLKVGDINLREGHIMCRSTMTKNKKTDYIPISKQLMDVLIEYKVHQLDPSLYLVGNGTKLTPSKKPTLRQRMTEAHAKAMEVCKMGDLKGELTL